MIKTIVTNGTLKKPARSVAKAAAGIPCPNFASGLGSGNASPPAASPAKRRRTSPRPPRNTSPGTSGRPDVDGSRLDVELGTAVPIGPAVVDLVKLAHEANVPILLVGPHGIGKSEIVAAAAAEMNIDVISRDLCLMEPPDLVGLPRIEGDKTSYCAPEFLPREPGRGGLLLFEELNRAPRYMQASCLELLTSRRLHSYRLPDKWLPIACINPKTDGYVVDQLDPALMSRFMRIEVTVAKEPWLQWARGSGIHPKIIQYVESMPDALDESKGGSNPRSWSKASKLLVAFERISLQSIDTIVRALCGVIGPVHTTALIELVFNTEIALTSTDVMENWPASKAKMTRWRQDARLDLLKASMLVMLTWLRPDGVAQQVRDNDQARKNVSDFFDSLPGDLAEQARASLSEQGYKFLIKNAASREAS